MYPVSVLPVPLQWLARLLPVTYSLEGMRQALLGGRQFRGTVAGGAGSDAFCDDSPAAFECDLCLGAAPDQDYRHAHAYVAPMALCIVPWQTMIT